MKKSIIITIALMFSLGAFADTVTVSGSAIKEGNVKLGLATEPGRPYEVESSENLSDWSNVTNVTAVSTSTTLTLPKSPDPGTTVFRASADQHK